MIRVAAISDSPKLTTGFANAAKSIYDGLYKEFELHVFGMLDVFHDVHHELPYNFIPTSAYDDLGISESMNFIYSVEPDVVWIMTDPGNLLKFVLLMERLKQKMTDEGMKPFKVLAYPPIEGTPVSSLFLDAFNIVEDNLDGKVVFWCKSARDAVQFQNDRTYDYIYFGADHAPFERYSPEDRQRLRHLVGLDDYFIIGAVGVNKRTKGHDKLIYIANELKEQGKQGNIKFYVHTNRDYPVLQGYRLDHLAKYYDVEDMFLWKPDKRQVYREVGRDLGTLELTKGMEKPETPDERKELWASYDFISRINCLDLYLDTSQVEGWGLPIGEAMACGVPVLMPDDDFVRTEVFGPGVIKYTTQPKSSWDTWHTGARLVSIQPSYVANMIRVLKSDDTVLTSRALKGMEYISQFKWESTQKQMADAIRRLHDK